MDDNSARASHILVSYEGLQGSDSGRSKEEAQELIGTIQAELANGADFAELAGEHSDCPSGAGGGELGEFGRGDMVPEFDEVVFDLEPGEDSDVVETAFGFHLIRRTE
ncbi:MAG: peptidyl-prolyl cis-trans isomerase [Alphaproteobacteria bacterium]|jgi:parvulin-like peptidyl-prolyl isomerase|nr:peptidyl-prolyl cis-trans isomerase [Alphaproteobacteria bacterium]|tara:strand:- start:144 stop:467 length:324 start_codon:yes stop_codon:yes gene_type:complete